MTAHPRRRDDVRVQLDALINFYTRHKMLVESIPINRSATEVARLLGQIPRSGVKVYTYRGFRIEATASDVVADRFRGGR